MMRFSAAWIDEDEYVPCACVDEDGDEFHTHEDEFKFQFYE